MKHKDTNYKGRLTEQLSKDTVLHKLFDDKPEIYALLWFWCICVLP